MPNETPLLIPSSVTGRLSPESRVHPSLDAGKKNGTSQAFKRLSIWRHLPFTKHQVVTKRCCLSWLTISALVYEPKCGSRGVGVGCGVSANEYSCAHGAQINVGDLTPYLTYAKTQILWPCCLVRSVAPSRREASQTLSSAGLCAGESIASQQPRDWRNTHPLQRNKSLNITIKMRSSQTLDEI